jgi:uncharacterized protein DUF6152
MNAKFAGFFAAIGLFLLAGTAFAHHPFAAEFDKDKPVHLTGTVSKVDWSNPHAMIFLDVKDSADHVVDWSIELGGPNALMRRGWSQSTLKQGDQVTIDGWQAKDGSHRANAKTVMAAHGKTLNAASSYYDSKNSH